MPNGPAPATGAVPPTQETAPAGAAIPIQEMTAMAALRSIFVIRTLGSKRRKLRTDCFGFAIDITTLLSASVRLVPGVHLSCCKCPTLKHRHTDAVGCRCRIVISGCRFDLRAGRTTPRQTARQASAHLSATGDAELCPDISVDRGGCGRTEVDIGGCELHPGK